MKTILFSLVLAVSIGAAHAGWLDALGFGNAPRTPPVPPPCRRCRRTRWSADSRTRWQRLAARHHDPRPRRRILTNLNVKIPLPEKLQTVEKTLRALKQEKLADEFVATMNHAAESAVPEAASCFWRRGETDEH